MRKYFKVGDLVKVSTSKIDTDGDITGVVVEVIKVDKDNELELLNAEEPKPEPRKVIQISESTTYAEGYTGLTWGVTALCNDGSMWIGSFDTAWERLPDIPQD